MKNNQLGLASEPQEETAWRISGGPPRDAFFLNHLQSVQAESAWYVNQKFLGKGGNGTTFLVTCTSGLNQDCSSP